MRQIWLNDRNEGYTILSASSSVFLRFALGFSFLSAVADRFGFWGSFGEPHVSWGTFARFITYTGQLNSFLPKATVPALAILATCAETLLGILLLLGWRTDRALLGGILLLLFAVTAPMWISQASRGEEWIARLRQLGTPVMDRVGTITYLDWLGLFEAAAPVGRYYAARSRSLAALTPEVISTLVAGGQRRSSPFSAIILHDFRGAPTRVPLAATAFGLRREHFMVEIIAAWDPTAEDDGEDHRKWARTLSEHLAPHALPGGYPNMLGPDDYEQTAHAYGANASRLQQLKRRFDPDGVFASAISLPL